MLLAHLSHRLLAQERHQGRVEIFLLEADVGARLLIDPASRPPGTEDVTGAETAGKFVEAAAQYRMIFPEGREQFRKYLFGTCTVLEFDDESLCRNRSASPCFDASR